MGAIICLILGSGFFIFGEKQKIGSVFLLIFLIPTTIIFHVFPFHQRAVFINLGLKVGLIIDAVREPKYKTLLKMPKLFFYFFSLNSGKQFAI